MDAAGAALLLLPLATLFKLPAQLLTGRFLHGGRNLFGLCDRLGNFLFRLGRLLVAVRKHFNAQSFGKPLAQFLDNLGEPLHRSQAGDTLHSCLAHGTHRAEIFTPGHHWRRDFLFQPFLADETELGQVIAEGLEFDGSLALV